MNVPSKFGSRSSKRFCQESFAPLGGNESQNRITFVRLLLRKINSGDEVFKQAAHKDQNDQMGCLSFARVISNWSRLDSFDGEIALVTDGNPGETGWDAMFVVVG